MTEPSTKLVELRRRAEALAVPGGYARNQALDPQRLLHELQVHEIELEIQNEELLAANAAVELLRAKYIALYESAPVGYLTLSHGGAILECNPAGASMLGYAPAETVGLRLRDSLIDDSVAAYDSFIRDARSSSLDTSSDNLLLKRRHAVPIYVRAQGRALPLPGYGEPVVLVVLMDVSALKYATDDVLSTIREAGLGPEGLPSG
jgi:PAS domain S-box-containing protein